MTAANLSSSSTLPHYWSFHHSFNQHSIVHYPILILLVVFIITLSTYSLASMHRIFSFSFLCVPFNCKNVKLHADAHSPLSFHFNLSTSRIVLSYRFIVPLQYHESSCSFFKKWITSTFFPSLSLPFHFTPSFPFNFPLQVHLTFFYSFRWQ